LNAALGTSIAGGPVTNATQPIQTVPQSITSCNPCVTVGLTPALIAQFLPLDTVTAASTGTVFPNSGTSGIARFVPFNFTQSANGHFETFSDNVSLDTGWTDFALNHNLNFRNPALTVSANPGGTQETFDTTSNATPGEPSPYRFTNGSNILG